MGSKRNSYKNHLAVLLLLSAPLAADAGEAAMDPMNYTGRYRVSWGGIAIGRIIIEAKETATSYQLSIDTKTSGIGAVLSSEKTVIAASGSKNAAGDKNAAGEYIPGRYETRPQKKKEEPDNITLTYDAEGKLAKRERTKEDDPSWRPLVPIDQINTGHDPLTSVFILRKMLHEAVAINHYEISTRAYDGMRLFDMKLTRLPDTTVETGIGRRDAVCTRVQRVPILGYTPKELKKFKKGDPNIRFCFSNDTAFMPLEARIETALGDVVMSLEKIEN